MNRLVYIVSLWAINKLKERNKTMNEVINLEEMPTMFGLCNQSECPHASTCLRHVVYPAVAKQRGAFINLLNPVWLAAQKNGCSQYLKSEKVRRAYGFIRTLKAIPSGQLDNFRWKAILRMGRKRYYQARKGEVMLTEAEAQMIIKLANQCGVKLDEYFDRYKHVLLWE